MGQGCLCALTNQNGLNLDLASAALLLTFLQLIFPPSSMVLELGKAQPALPGVWSSFARTCFVSVLPNPRPGSRESPFPADPGCAKASPDGLVSSHAAIPAVSVQMLGHDSYFSFFFFF